jgi:uncharacterized protein
MKRLIQCILRETTIPERSLHGLDHWKRVADNARLIAKHENVNLRIMLLFAFFHDCRRESDGDDPGHGPRAARYIRGFSEKQLGLSSQDKQRLMLACRHHTYECDTNDLTVKACWDADRLDQVEAAHC